MTRKDDARAFAEAMGWEFVFRDDEYAPEEHPEFFGQFEWRRSEEEIAASEDGDEIESLGVPPADAPLHEHLAFVGRVAPTGLDMEIQYIAGGGFRPSVRFGRHNVQADDISWAALKAATAAKLATR